MAQFPGRMEEGVVRERVDFFFWKSDREITNIISGIMLRSFYCLSKKKCLLNITNKDNLILKRNLSLVISIFLEGNFNI